LRIFRCYAPDPGKSINNIVKRISVLGKGTSNPGRRTNELGR